MLIGGGLPEDLGGRDSPEGKAGPENTPYPQPQDIKFFKQKCKMVRVLRLFKDLK